jgi:hypothetical protein
MPAIKPESACPAPLSSAGAGFACLTLAGLCVRPGRLQGQEHHHLPDPEGAGARPGRFRGGSSRSPTEPPAMRWSAPAGWQAQPASGMRQGSFLVQGAGGATADVSVVSFPGTGGDDLANINRWREPAEAGAGSQPPSSPGRPKPCAPAGEFVIADLAGTGDKGPARILGAWLRQPDRVWFFKMMGPADLVEGAEGRLCADFLQVRQPGEQGHRRRPALAQSGPGFREHQRPSGRGEAGSRPRPPVGRRPRRPWTRSRCRPRAAPRSSGRLRRTGRAEAGSAMRRGSYAREAPRWPSRPSPGDVGGVLANVNRWRGQAGLEPVDASGPRPGDVRL